MGKLCFCSCIMKILFKILFLLLRQLCPKFFIISGLQILNAILKSSMAQAFGGFLKHEVIQAGLVPVKHFNKALNSGLVEKLWLALFFQKVLILVIGVHLPQDTFQMSCIRWLEMDPSPVSTVRVNSFQKVWIRYVCDYWNWSFC